MLPRDLRSTGGELFAGRGVMGDLSNGLAEGVCPPAWVRSGVWPPALLRTGVWPPALLRSGVWPPALLRSGVWPPALLRTGVWPPALLRSGVWPPAILISAPVLMIGPVLAGAAGDPCSCLFVLGDSGKLVTDCDWFASRTMMGVACANTAGEGVVGGVARGS